MLDDLPPPPQITKSHLPSNRLYDLPPPQNRQVRFTLKSSVRFTLKSSVQFTMDTARKTLLPGGQYLVLYLGGSQLQKLYAHHK